VHGIDDCELVDAPAFGDIAGDLIERMRDAVLVGHNVSFDMRFLRAEFGRIGHMVPDLFSVCTVSMARKIGMQAPRTLSACCHRYGVDLFNAHSALDDVKATAELMFAMKRHGCDPTRCREVPGWRGRTHLARLRSYGATAPARGSHVIAIALVWLAE